MLTPEFKKYLELYNDLVSIVAAYHNRNQDFKFRPSEINAQDLRRMLRELRKIEKEMGHLVWDIFIIEKKRRAEARKLKKETDRLDKINNPKPKGRPKTKRENNVNN